MNIRLYKKSPGGMAGGDTRGPRHDHDRRHLGRGGRGAGRENGNRPRASMYTVWYMSDKKASLATSTLSSLLILYSFIYIYKPMYKL